MLIAHAPAAYLCAKTFYQKQNSNTLKYILVFVVASLAPDTDLAYFYLIDNRAHNHHSYWLHIPIFWLGLYTLIVSIALAFGRKKIIYYASIALAGVLLHLFLDTLTGGILWGLPFSKHYYVFIHVPSTYHWWVLNFIFHWSFLVEIVLSTLAIHSLYKSQKAKKLQQTQTSND